MAQKVWDMVPNYTKNVNGIEVFKNSRKWNQVNCHCKF